MLQKTQQHENKKEENYKTTKDNEGKTKKDLQVNIRNMKRNDKESIEHNRNERQQTEMKETK